ncbi:MAG: hypothetical protein Kow0059_19090 [Candidatus Sumerlaeia bacterium]
MKTNTLQRTRRGNILLGTLLLITIVGIAVTGLMKLSLQRFETAHAEVDYTEAYYHAENAIEWAGQLIADAQDDAAAGQPAGGNQAPQSSPQTASTLSLSNNGPLLASTQDNNGNAYAWGRRNDDGEPSFIGRYQLSAGTLPLAYKNEIMGTNKSRLRDIWLTIKKHPSGINNYYVVTASAQVGDKVRTLTCDIRKNPPSLVFDYEYFLNNWGWWWGAGITGFGDNRANWDFDFRYNPIVNGNIFANGNIESNMVPINPFSGKPPFRGLAASDPIQYSHIGVNRVPMPNLLDFSYYEAKARAAGGTLSIGGEVVIDAVHSIEGYPGIYLEGTDELPIQINGPVVVPGDVVIKGKITGIGTLYVGGNLYIAGDVTYVNGPNFDTPPAMMSPADRDAWVENAVNQQKDLVCFAVRETILGGQVNSSDWIKNCYNPSGYGLKFVGDERFLGPDGIADTPDDGVLFRDTNGDGRPDSSWYDADGDGVVDLNYNYDTQIEMTAARASRIYLYPTQAGPNGWVDPDWMYEDNDEGNDNGNGNNGNGNNGNGNNGNNGNGNRGNGNNGNNGNGNNGNGNRGNGNNENNGNGNNENGNRGNGNNENNGNGNNGNYGNSDPNGNAWGHYKIPVCHKGRKTLWLPAPAVAAHLAHGDTLGECVHESPDQNDSDTPLDYSNLATNNFNTLNGVFYTNHAMAMRAAARNFLLEGAMICRDEAIIFTTTCTFKYDMRLHHRYSDDPNRFIDLGLPVANRVRNEYLAEVEPVAGFAE